MKEIDFKELMETRLTNDTKFYMFDVWGGEIVVKELTNVRVESVEYDGKIRDIKFASFNEDLFFYYSQLNKIGEVDYNPAIMISDNNKAETLEKYKKGVIEYLSNRIARIKQEIENRNKFIAKLEETLKKIEASYGTNI